MYMSMYMCVYNIMFTILCLELKRYWCCGCPTLRNSHVKTMMLPLGNTMRFCQKHRLFSLRLGRHQEKCVSWLCPFLLLLDNSDPTGEVMEVHKSPSRGGVPSRRNGLPSHTLAWFTVQLVVNQQTSMTYHKSTLNPDVCC